MPADTKQIEGQLTADAVTADWLAANKPGLVESIKAEASAQAVAAERARVSGILALGIAGHADLVRAAIESGQTGGDLAVAVLKAESAQRQSLAAAHAADAAAATVEDTPPPAEDAGAIDGVVSAAVAAMNKGRK